MTGAVAYYRNPSSHREVELDFITAFDKVVVASDLLKAVEDADIKQNKA